MAQKTKQDEAPPSPPPAVTDPEIERLSVALTDLSAKLALARAAARRWMEQHGPACPCNLCRDTREALRGA